MIKLNNVCYSYDDDIVALEDINLNISSGESAAFIGSNGSGKSTLLKLLSGLVLPDRGSYYFDGTEITAKKLQDNRFSKSFHKRIGFVFQNSEAQLFCSSVYDEIAFGPRQMGMSEEDTSFRVNDMLKMLQLYELKDRQPYHLSGGEKKKVAIASVLVLSPDVLVFDEPMNGLDPRTKRFLKKLMITLRDAGKTILCSTHDFDYVGGIFKRAIVFSSNHTIVRDGNYDEIISDETFLYENNII